VEADKAKNWRDGSGVFPTCLPWQCVYLLLLAQMLLWRHCWDALCRLLLLLLIGGVLFVKRAFVCMVEMSRRSVAFVILDFRWKEQVNFEVCAFEAQ